MEPRRGRPLFYNPFTEATKYLPNRPWFRGFFRCMPLHRWSLSHIERVLEFAAMRPCLFGLPNNATCIVNTAHFLPSSRSRSAGVWVFGQERGCKTLVVPSSCSDEGFDTVDAKLVEPLFRWNPGLEYVYLSRACQGMTAQLIPQLSKLRNLTMITLEGWTDAVAIHKVMMICKSVEVLDLYSIDEQRRDWTNELSVQALTTLVEMHPKIRAVQGSRALLEKWYAATKYSRCKHNVALMPETCSFAVFFITLYVTLMLFLATRIYAFVDWLLIKVLKTREDVGDLSAFVIALVSFFFLLIDDHVNRHRRGRTWVNLCKYLILFLRRVALSGKGSAIAKK